METMTASAALCEVCDGAGEQIRSFTPVSGLPAAQSVRKSVANIHDCLPKAEALRRLAGLPLDKEIAKANDIIEEAEGKTVAWGAVQLLNRRDVMHPSKGIETRAKLRSLQDAHLDKLEKYSASETLADIKNAISIDAVKSEQNTTSASKKRPREAAASGASSARPKRMAKKMDAMS